MYRTELFVLNWRKIGRISPFLNFWLVGPVCVSEIGNQIVIQSTMSWLVTMQNFNLIAQSVQVIPSQKSINDDNDDDDDDDTHPGWIIVRDGKYSVADKK